MATETLTAPGKNKAGEDVTIEIPIPAVNRVDDWNAAIQSGYEKAGVEVPGAAEAKPAAAAAAVSTDTKKKDDDPAAKVRATLNVNGAEMEFLGDDAADVLRQYSAAVEAARLAAQPAAAAATPEKKPELSAADMFDVGTKLIAGDASGLDTLLEKSGALNRWFEKQGVSIDQIKAATTATQNNTVHNAWKEATDQFKAKVAAGEIDFPGGEQNMKMMGYTIARLGLKPSLASMEQAWAEMKKEQLIFPVSKEEKKTETAAATSTTKTATSSTAIGTAGTTKETAAVIDPNRKFEIDMTKMSVAQASEAWNSLLQQGVKPEQINVIRQ